MSFWRFSEPATGAAELSFSYDPWLVALSIAIAITGAFAMLRAVDRFRTAQTTAQRAIWAVSGAVSMAFGIWSMHFAGMMAIALPTSMDYDFWPTAASVLPALLGSFITVYVIGARRISAPRLHSGALLLGISISAMHYVGMEGMRFDGFFRYDEFLFVVSIVGAYALSLAALTIRPTLSATSSKHRPWQREALSATLLGGAVGASHYVAMAAATFYSSARTGFPTLHVPPYVLEGLIIAMALVTSIVWLGSVFDNQLASVSASLRHSEALNRAVIMAMRDAHFLTDSRGIIVSMNPAAASMFGYEPTELIGQNVSVLMPDPHRKKHDEYIERHLRTGESKILGVSRRNELYGQRKDGTSFPIEILITRFEMTDQKFFSGTIRDLSEYAASMESTKRLIAAIDQSAEAIVIVDPDMRVVFANPAFWKHTSTTAKESLGRPLDAFAWNPAEAHSFVEMLSYVRAGKTWSGKLVTTLADGSIIHESVTTTPVVTSGTITCHIQVRRNITDQLLMEQQLRHAQKLESIGQLSAGIAHELNTPSQFVRDNILFLQDAYQQILSLIEAVRTDSAQFEAAARSADLDYLREEVPRALSQSIDGMNRITTIVRAMKEFSHQGRDKTPSDLNHAIESTITVATNEWKYVAEVVFDLEPNLPPVPCVLDEFNQVVLNIVVNAAHAIADVIEKTKGQKGTITVSTRHIHDFVEIRIADTGTGMPPEVKARIFEPFYTTKEVGRGTGQGLSIAYAIVVEKHGGSIEVETKVGRGSCFVIRLPLAEPGDQTSAAA